MKRKSKANPYGPRFVSAMMTWPTFDALGALRAAIGAGEAVAETTGGGPEQVQAESKAERAVLDAERGLRAALLAEIRGGGG